MRWLLILLLFPLVALASGDKNINVTDVATEVATGDVSLTGSTSRALGLGRSSFDVDINQCMGSTAWDTIVGGKQKLVLNWVCLAEFYIKTGQPDLAAIAICNTEMVKEFKNEAECEQAHDFFVEVSEAAVMMPDNSEHEEEEARWHEDQLQMQIDYDDRIARLEDELNERPQVIERTVIEQRPLLSEEAAAALRIKK